MILAFGTLHDTSSGLVPTAIRALEDFGTLTSQQDFDLANDRVDINSIGSVEDSRV